MSTEITPYDASLALQYIGVRFRRFVYAIQQSMGRDVSAPSDWLSFIRMEVVSVLSTTVGYTN